jgi:hypothetical protein
MESLNVGNDFSLFEFIEEAIVLLGASKIDVCTFSISDDGVRFLAHLKENDLLTSARIIIDSSAIKNKTDVILSAEKVAKIRFAPNHSKIVLIRGKVGNGYIITSSNFNLTKRNELVLLGFEKQIFEQLSDFYENLWLDGIQQ